MRGGPEQLSNRIFAEATGIYPSIGHLSKVLAKIYDRHLHEIPAGYGLDRLLDVGAEEGYIVREADGSLRVRSLAWVEPPAVPGPYIHGSHLGREHHSLRRHLIEDHHMDPKEAKGLSDGGAHGLHDRVHDRTWAYAFDVPHTDPTPLRLEPSGV